ncbi:ThiF family adenylyltransferase [Phototrophicus methaneseepsis]|uniref:ThiF family adenylyltransferase n=1 Tax=Phototrophicus methaneseepsis TaxID=2710758 RepID=A0A7S8IE61_9CHLR|nr:ThiF family adenylyltransferase [Phototrophicus methaneseepsis]QPC82276.1 ThiF family adenylyltransferase [Phototrophicus methaneseepsis]
MTVDWKRVEGLFGPENLRFLAQKRVGVVGCGSGGGFVALSLAMSGVRNFVLVDNDALETGNVVRHVCDLRYVGQNKAAAVADLIKQRNPQAEIDVREGYIQEHLDALEGLDILVVGVDGENAKYLINEAVLKRHLTAVYAGVYERGEGGDVVIIRPYDGPCYACWAEELREGAKTPKPGETELDYGMIGESGTLEAEPGLWIHVAKVASIQTDIVLNELLRGTDLHRDMPGNTVIIANRALEIVDGQVSDPHTGVWVNIPRDPDCLVCGDKLRLSDEAHQAISLDDLASSVVFEEEFEEDESEA